MAIVLGIDEAGYGPTLGPLLVAATAWQVEPRRIKSDFWTVLGEAIVRKPDKNDWRLVVDDSKCAYDRAAGIGSLERTVLAFASATGQLRDSLDALLTEIGSDGLQAGPIPWYRELTTPLPHDRVRAKPSAVSQRLIDTMQELNVRCIRLQAAAVPEDQFNQRVAHTQNKSELVVEQVLRHIAWAGSMARQTDLHVFVDRLGGRTDYRGILSLAFPERHLHVVSTSDECSAYRLASAENDWYIEFRVEADQHHMPVALASMVAKYVREALMLRFNAFWRQWMPDLRPTAGYHTDAQRFLKDVKAILPKAGVPTALFVRTR